MFAPSYFQTDIIQRSVARKQKISNCNLTLTLRPNFNDELVDFQKNTNLLYLVQIYQKCKIPEHDIGTLKINL